MALVLHISEIDFQKKFINIDDSIINLGNKIKTLNEIEDIIVTAENEKDLLLFSKDNKLRIRIEKL